MIKDFRSISLHIGDLDVSTTEEDLLTFFKPLGDNVVTNVKVVREHTPANTSLRYGYVNFLDKAIAEKALDTLNYTEIKGKACRLTWVQPDPTQRRSQVGNLFIKPIPPDYKTRDLHDLFSVVGPVISCKISPYKTEKAGVHGYVQFATKELADKAIQQFHDREERGVKLQVVPARAKSDIIHDTVFVKGFSAELGDEELQEEFAKVAPVKRAMIHRDKEKKISKQFGFVTFNNEEDATKAVNELNEKEVKGAVVKVSIARTKWEREQYKKKLRQKTRFLNLYVRGFPADFDDAKLRELFQEYGKITSCVIMKNEVGTSRGFGFCCFEKEEEARNAMAINGKDFENGNSLVVNYSQSQEERRAINVKRIQDMHAQQQQQQQQQQYPYGGGVGGVGVNAGVSSGVQGYPYGYPASYAAGAGVNANAAVGGGYLYQQPLNPQQLQQQRKAQVPPTQQQQQQQQYVNAAVLQQQQRQIQQQQFAQQQQRYPQQYAQQRAYAQQQYQQQQAAAAAGYPPAQSPAQAQAYAYGAAASAYAQQQIPQAQAQAQQYPVVASQAQTAAAQQQQQQPAQQTSTTASVASQSGQSDSSMNKSVVVDMSKLAQLSPDDQKQYLGELIYPRVHSVDADNAGKITGMLLELDVTELVHILEDRNELQAKILEAQNVLLQAVSQQQLQLQQQQQLLPQQNQ